MRRYPSGKNTKKPYRRARTIRADHILCCDHPAIFKSDVTELWILHIASQPDHLQRSIDDDTEASQLLLECTLRNALGDDENIWVSSV